MRWMIQKPGLFACVAIATCLAVAAGCRKNDPAVAPAELPAANDPASPTELSVEQKAAIEAITATGGEIQTDDSGLPISIDLASERVYADEALVRAALAFPDLNRLRLTLSAVPQETLSELATLTCLEELFLQDADLDAATLADIVGAMPNLRRLTLRRLNGVTDEALDAVAALEHLEVLALIEMNQITVSGLKRPVSGARGLRSLDLRNCGRLTIDDFGALSGVESLDEVKFAGPAINDAIADVIVSLPAVRSVTIEDAQISGDLLSKLAAHSATAQRLGSLAFARCFGVTDDALASLSAFPNLENLLLRDITITGEFLAAMRDSGSGPLHLKTLVAINAFFDDETAALIPIVAPNLVRLDLRGNAGLGEPAKQTFEELQNLKELKLE